MSEFRRYAEKLNLTLEKDVVITANNVKNLGEYIAVSSLRRVMHYHGERGYKLYHGLLDDIVHTKGANETISEGYELASEAICFLCEYIGKPLGTILTVDKQGKEITIKDMCFKTVFRYIHKNESYVGKVVDIDNSNIIEKSVPFENEDVKEKDINKIMRKMKLTFKQKQAINLIMEGSNPYQVSKYLKVSNVAIYERVKQVRKKYIKIFGVPYANYTIIQ